jgi:transglutaminase-like putative cysteine protease
MITRRDLIALTPLILLSLPALGRVEDRKVKAVRLRITHTTQILKPLKKARLWVPIPRSDHAQEVRGLKVSSPLPYRITEEKVWGNRSLFIEAREVPPGKVEVTFELLRRREGPARGGPDPKMCLKPSEWEVWDKEIERFVDGVVGRERDPVRIARKLYDAIIDRTKLLDGVCGRGVSVLTFQQRIGRCDEFHALYRSCLMYKGVPASWEEGIVLPYPSQLKKRDSYEADCLKTISWVRFYDGSRWVPVDLAEAKRRPDLRDFYFGNIPPNRFRVSRGRGIRLEPPQREVLNIFAYTHIEEEGIPAIYGHHYRNTVTYELLKVEVEG